MELIVEMRFGSHLYGTATPQSDLDFKAVYVPDARDNSVAETGFLAQADALFASLLLSEPRASNFEAAPPRSGTDTCS